MAKALWDSVAAIWSKKTRECCKRGWDPIFMERRPRTGSGMVIMAKTWGGQVTRWLWLVDYFDTNRFGE